jgi:glycosyltransferase involved in cell wall biosynthesis
MRVLVVLTTRARRGAEIEGHRVATELRKRGCDAVAVSLSGAPPGVEELPVDVLGSGAMGAVLRLRKVAREFDVVVAFGSRTLPSCALALAGARVPWVYRSIGDPAAWAGGRAKRLRTSILMRRAAAVVALWEGAASWIRSSYRVRRVAVIPNARSREDFRPISASERAEAGRELFGNSDRTVAMVGALTEEKRADLGIRIVAELPGTNLLVAGDGPMRRSLETLAADIAPGRVRFLGSVPDVRRAYAAADVLVVPSRTEGMPGVVIEALMCGVGVVASRVGAVESIHPDVRALDPDAPLGDWVDRVDEVASAKARPVDMAGYDWGVVGDAWLDVLTSVVSPKAAS